jgi:hypothetical protein
MTTTPAISRAGATAASPHQLSRPLLVERGHPRRRELGVGVLAQHVVARHDGRLGQRVEQCSVVGVEAVEVEHRELAPHVGLGLGGLLLGREREVRDDHRAGFAARRRGEAEEARVADRALVEREHLRARGIGAVGDERRERRGAVRHREVDLAVGEELVELVRVLRVGRALAPQRRREVGELVEERGRQLGEVVVAVGQRHVVDAAVDAVEHLADEDRAGEVRRRGVGEAARVGARPVEKLLERRRHVGHGVAVVDERELGLVPGGLAAVDGRAEVVEQQRVVRVGELHVGQKVGPAALPRTGLLAGAEVVAVDPDEVDLAVRLARLHLAEDAVERVGRVGDRHLLERDAELGGRGHEHVVDVGVALLVAAVHPELHGLAVGGLEHLLPAVVLLVVARGGRGRAGGERGDEAEREGSGDGAAAQSRRARRGAALRGAVQGDSR